MKTRHTLTIEFYREPVTGPAIPRDAVDTEVTDIKIDGEDVAMFLRGLDLVNAFSLASRLVEHFEANQ